MLLEFTSARAASVLSFTLEVIPWLAHYCLEREVKAAQETGNSVSDASNRGGTALYRTALVLVAGQSLQIKIQW